jgi:hypothetical protein
MATPTDDEIMERQATSPMATACLLISFFALLGAVILNLFEIGEYRAGLPAAVLAEENAADAVIRKDKTDFEKRVKTAIEKNTEGDEKHPFHDVKTEEEKTPPGPGDAETRSKDVGAESSKDGAAGTETKGTAETEGSTQETEDAKEPAAEPTEGGAAETTAESESAASDSSKASDQ